MRKLLSANFFRLWKNKFFWLSFAFMTVGSLFFGRMTYQTYHTAMQNADATFTTEDLLFNLLPMIGFVCAIFVSFWTGTEFDDHTIRNKLVAGHTHTCVFFAEYVTCLIASLILLFAMLLVSGVAGYVFFRKFLLRWTELSCLILCCVLLTAVFSSICVGIAMNVQSKAGAVVASFLFLFAILFLASYCQSELAADAMMYSDVQVFSDGVRYGDLVPNPEYIGGFQRIIYRLITDMLPTGQMIQINNLEYEQMSLQRWPFLSVIMLILSCAAGYLPFRKRDIK